MSRTIATVLSMRDQFTAPAKKAASSVKNINREVKKTENQIKRMAASAKRQFANMAKYSAAAGVAIGVAFAKKSVDAAKVQIEAETKLQAVLKNTKGMTDQQIDSVKKYAGELQNVGVIGDEVALSGVQQLGSYQLQADTLKKLMPGMNDLLAQQKGLNASTGDAVNIGNMLGKVMTGQVGALSRAGINFSEAQEQVLKYGTEQEKAAILAKVLQQNVGGVNKALSETDQGKIQQAKNAFGDMQEEVGKRLLPVLGNFSSWFMTKIPGIQKNILSIADETKKMYKQMEPYLKIVKDMFLDIWSATKKVYDFTSKNISTIAPIIMTVVGAMTLYKGIMVAQVAYTKAFAAAEFIKNAVLATGAATVNAVTIAQWAWNAAMTANPIGLVIAGITALVAVGIVLYKNFDKITARLSNMFKFFGKIKNIAGKAWESVKKFFGGKDESPVPTTPGMDTYASGGIANRPSIFGEAGPEIAIPLNRSSRSQKLLETANKKIGNTGSSGTSVNVTINGDVYGFEDFKDKVTQAWYEAVNGKLNNMA